MKKLLCKIGLHWLKNHSHRFTDLVSRKPIYFADCECGKKWLVDSKIPFLGFRIPQND